ncbi:MAG: exosortase-associated EpsI family protein, partial [Rhodopirellula sp.]|nr:exosortase-associated EpsI family protein [Rhodopirellula sp.]
MKERLVLLTLLAITTAFLAWFGESMSDTAWPVLALPEEVGRFRGADIFYCQNEFCMHSLTAADSDTPAKCPKCGSTLDTMALAERRLLPADTSLIRRKYEFPGSPAFFVSIVVSGQERRSIHKPQVCLVGQGYAITSQRTLAVPLLGTAPLHVMLLGLTRRSAEQSSGMLYSSSYMYWFTDGHHRTPYHVSRLLLMARDNIVHGIRRRWAYITIASQSSGNAKEDVDEMRDFAQKL